MMPKLMRVAALSMALSATGFIAIVAKEDYTEKAVVPTKNDRPTLGYGSTFHEDGSPVKMGDKTTPVRALIKARAHISKEEEIFRASLAGVELHQDEYDLYFDFTYQYGTGTWVSSGMLDRLKVGDYVGACEALKQYRFLTSANPTPGWEPYRFDRSGKPIRWKFDCATPGNKTCAGVWTRQLDRINKCMAVQ